MEDPHRRAQGAGLSRWHGDDEARGAVYTNRTRLRSGVAKEAFKLRAEMVERSFALNLDRGGMRRTWLRGRENVHKRYLVHVAGYNLGLLMRLLIGAGTPREFLARVSAHLLVLTDRRRRRASSSSSSPPAPKPRCSSSASSRSRTTESRLPQRAALMFAVKYLVASVRPCLSADGMLA